MDTLSGECLGWGGTTTRIGRRTADGQTEDVVSAPTGEQTGTGSGTGAPPEGAPPATPPTPPPAPPAGPPAGTGEKTFSQAELDRIVQDRIARERGKFADYDDLKAKAGQLDQVQRERETETEKARREAVEEAERNATARVMPKLVAAEFRAAAAGRIEAARLTTLTEDIDFGKYVDDNGVIDTDKIAKKVEAWAPAPTEEQKPGGRAPKPDHSQGPRGGKVTGLSAGAEMFQARRGKRPATT